MDVDPLADVAPPRHAIESDDEDEDEGNMNILHESSSISSVNVKITFKTERQSEEMEKHVPLIVASGQAGNALFHLLGRPSLSSRVYANSVEVFFSFCLLLRKR